MRMVMMKAAKTRTVALLAICIPFAIAQQLQPNLTICNWAGLRTGIVRDTIYLDGGNLWWQIGTNSDGLPIPEKNRENDGLMFSFNLSYAFDTTKFNETTALLQTISKTGGTAANNIAPNYVDGALFANEGEFYLYGGLLRATDSFSTPPDAQAILGYEAYQYGPERSGWSRGFLQSALSDDVTRYVSNGAAVSVPSENLAFYFSGLRAPDWGSITLSSDDWVPADTLIGVDMSTMRAEQWSNSTLPDDVPPRAGAELVWIPVGGQGALIAIGGMTAVEYRYSAGLNSSQVSDAEQQAPGFMTSLPVYDIVTKTWYTQNTTGDGPRQLTSFCSVMAPAKDSSSFNIYIYGGYDGLNYTSIPSDDVWILSIPTFTWIKAYSGVRGRGRRGHKCERIYPDQMLIMGGVNPDAQQCLEDGPIQIFNLNSLEFQAVYNPREWSEYTVPDIVTAIIGGDGNGSSSRTTTFSDNALSSLFGTPYTKTINKYYPYAAASGTPGPSPIPTSTTSSGGLAKWVAPVLGVVLSLIVLSIIAVLILLYRRRRRNSATSSNAGSSYNNRIQTWVSSMRNQPSDQKTDPSVISTTECESEGNVSSPVAGRLEVGGQQRYEVEGTEKTPLVELPTDYNVQIEPKPPRPKDFAYGAGASDVPSQSQSQPSGNGSRSRIYGPALTATSRAVSPQSLRSTFTHTHSNSGDSTSPPLAHASSHPVQPHSPEDVGAGAGTRSPINLPSPISSTAKSPDTQNAGSNNVVAGGVSASGGLEHRPAYQRNTSSLSSFNFPSPDIYVSPEDDRRQSQILSIWPPAQEAGMSTGPGRGPLGSSGGTAPSGTYQLGISGEPSAPAIPNSPIAGLGLTITSNGAEMENKKTAAKKSSFGEMLDDGGGGDRGLSDRKN